MWIPQCSDNWQVTTLFHEYKQKSSQLKITKKYDAVICLSLKRADIAVASLTVTESREKIVDFSVPYMYYSREILVKKSPHSGKVDLLQFMNPFDIQVWFATLASLIIISVAVFVINYFSPYGCKDENGRGTSEEFNFFNSVWFALACMLQQGGDNTPKSSSGGSLHTKNHP